MRRSFARSPVLLVLSLFALGAAPRGDRHGDPLPDGALARLGTIRQRVAASHLTFSADGRTLITVTAGRGIGRWNAVTGKMRDYRLLPGRPTDRCWLSADGRLLAVGEPKGLAVFDTATGARKHLLAVPDGHVTFRSDGKMLVTGASEKSRNCVRLWDLATGKDRLLAELPNYVKDFVFSPDGKRLFAAVDNHSLRCWDLESGKQLWKNDHWADYLAVSPDGRTLCSHTYQPSDLHLWDANTGRRIGEGKIGDSRWIGRLAFAPDGRTVFLTNHKDVLLWDMAKGKIQRRIADTGYCYAVAPDGKMLASICGALLRRWDVESGKPLDPDTAELGHTNAVRAVVFAPDGRTIVTTGADGTIRIWDAATQRPRILRRDALSYSGGIRQLHIDGYFGTYCPPILAVTPDGRRVLSHTGDRQLRLTDLRTGEEVRRFDVRGEDGRTYVIAARLSADGRTLWALTYHWPTPSGGMMVVDHKETLIGWDMAIGRCLSSHALKCLGDLEDFVIAPDGRTVALEECSVRDVLSGRDRLKPDDWLLHNPFAFSADCRLLAGVVGNSSQWNTIAVYELLTNRPLIQVEAAFSWSSHFAFSPDGRLLIASGRDALHVWEVSSGRRLLHLPAEGRLPAWTPELFGTCLAVAPDGRSAATGHEDGTVLLWDLAPVWRRLAERPTATLTAAELDSCWPDLLKDDPRTAYAAIDHLTAASAQALPLLRKRLRPVTIPAQWLTDRLADLDSSEFATREKATHDLEAIAEAIEPRLRQAMTKGVSLEVRHRLQAILETAQALVPAAETVRQLRAVAVLERIATTEARALLHDLARGELTARLTRAATAACARLRANP